MEAFLEGLTDKQLENWCKIQQTVYRVGVVAESEVAQADEELLVSFIIGEPEIPTEPGQITYAAGLAPAATALYVSDSNAAGEWTLRIPNLSAVLPNEEQFPRFPVVAFWNLETLEKVEASTLKVSVRMHQLAPGNPWDVDFVFQDHSVAPLKKGETLAITIAG